MSIGGIALGSVFILIGGLILYFQFYPLKILGIKVGGGL